MENKLKLGIYGHYKGGLYDVIRIEKHAKRLGNMVIYRALGGDGPIRRKLLTAFMEEAEVNGKKIPRFKRIRCICIKP